MKNNLNADATAEQMPEQSNLEKSISQTYTENPENRYRVVYYIPSVQQLKEYYTGLVTGQHGYCSLVEQVLKEKGYDSIEKLTANSYDFFAAITSKPDLYPNPTMRGIQDKETGKIINRGYVGIYSYHPDEGYVIFHIQTERDFWWINQSFQVVSLKNGKEVGPNLVEYSISGIKDSTLSGIVAHSRSCYPIVYKIDDETNDFIPIGEMNDDSDDVNERFGLPDPNWFDKDNYGIETITTEIPFFNDDDFVKEFLEKQENPESVEEKEEVTLESVPVEVPSVT